MIRRVAIIGVSFLVSASSAFAQCNLTAINTLRAKLPVVRQSCQTVGGDIENAKNDLQNAINLYKAAKTTKAKKKQKQVLADKKAELTALEKKAKPRCQSYAATVFGLNDFKQACAQHLNVDYSPFAPTIDLAKPTIQNYSDVQNVSDGYVRAIGDLFAKLGGTVRVMGEPRDAGKAVTWRIDRRSGVNTFAYPNGVFIKSEKHDYVIPSIDGESLVAVQFTHPDRIRDFEQACPRNIAVAVLMSGADARVVFFNPQIAGFLFSIVKWHNGFEQYFDAEETEAALLSNAMQTTQDALAAQAILLNYMAKGNYQSTQFAARMALQREGAQQLLQ